jgi:hypothetical protein
MKKRTSGGAFRSCREYFRFGLEVGLFAIRMAFLDGGVIGRLFEMAVSNWTLVRKGRGALDER